MVELNISMKNTEYYEFDISLGFNLCIHLWFDQNPTQGNLKVYKFL